MDKVNIAEKLAFFGEHWSPKVVGEWSGQHVKLVEFPGEFVWHHHEHADELLLVVKGRFRMDFRDREVWLDSSTAWSPTRRSTCGCSIPPRR